MGPSAREKLFVYRIAHNTNIIQLLTDNSLKQNSCIKLVNFKYFQTL